jgi:transcriptional regulator of acetoin/glycerol metabolism
MQLVLSAHEGSMHDPKTKLQLKPLREFRKEHILHVLRSTGGDIARASQILGISRTTLRRNIKHYGLSLEEETEKIQR